MLLHVMMTLLFGQLQKRRMIERHYRFLNGAKNRGICIDLREGDVFYTGRLNDKFDGLVKLDVITQTKYIGQHWAC